MKSVRTINRLAKDEKGIASIMVAGIFIVIISLVATGFATLMRREQRQALDKQLSTQAYYAAESGVNDAIKYLATHPSAKSSDCSKTADVTGNTSFGTNNDAISYTCVLVDTTPDSLNYNPISTDKSTILKLNAAGADTINISWQDSANNQNYVTASDGHPLSNADSRGVLHDEVWQSGVLRVSLMPITQPITREKLIKETQTLFLYPNLNTTTGRKGTHQFSASKAGQGVFVDGECNLANSDINPEITPYDCNMKITNLPAGVDSYYIRLKSILTNHSVRITANGDGNQIELPGTQAVIDATGKANDVLRRIQVRVPINANYSYPEFGLETTNAICKDLELYVHIPDHLFNMDKDNCS
jgi:Tfp pilus assembly protein PilX